MENKNKIIDELNNIIYELKNKLYDTKSNNKILINNINYYKKINDILCEENEELKAEIHNMKYPIDELVDVVEEFSSGTLAYLYQKSMVNILLFHLPQSLLD